MPETRIRRLLLAGAILGAAVGGSVGTVINGTSGPTFWAGLGLGAFVGPICLVAAFALLELGRSVRRRVVHRT